MKKTFSLHAGYFCKEFFQKFNQNAKNCLDPGQAGCLVGSDLRTNFLHRLSAKDKGETIMQVFVRPMECDQRNKFNM